MDRSGGGGGLQESTITEVNLVGDLDGERVVGSGGADEDRPPARPPARPGENNDDFVIASTETTRLA